mgnify:FL=1
MEEVIVLNKMAQRKCKACGGTGYKVIMTYKTVWEPQTVTEYVTQWQAGKPVRVARSRVVTKAV